MDTDSSRSDKNSNNPSEDEQIVEKEKTVESVVLKDNTIVIDARPKEEKIKTKLELEKEQRDRRREEGGGDESSQDIIDLLEVHDDNKTIQEKLGLRPKYGIDLNTNFKNSYKYNQLNEDKKKEIDDAAVALKNNRKKAEVLILDAVNKLEQIKQETIDAIQEVADLKVAIEEKKKEIIVEEAREKTIEDEYNEQIKKMQMSKIGEIHWIMMESREEENAEHKESYAWIIHNYLMLLFLEDHEEDQLKDDIEARQKQIHDNFSKQFKEFTDPIRNAKNPHQEFIKMFPKPEPNGENAEKFDKFYQMYDDWVQEEFQGAGNNEDDTGILMSTTGSEFNSSVNASAAHQSVPTQAAHDKEEDNAILEEDETDYN